MNLFLKRIVVVTVANVKVEFKERETNYNELGVVVGHKANDNGVVVVPNIYSIREDVLIIDNLDRKLEVTSVGF